jgi:hypothetical protein
VGGGVGEGAPVNRDRVASAGIARVAQGRWRRRQRGEEVRGIWSGRGRRGNFTKSPDALAIAHISGCATMRLSNGAPLGVRHCLFMSGSKE